MMGDGLASTAREFPQFGSHLRSLLRSARTVFGGSEVSAGCGGHGSFGCDGASLEPESSCCQEGEHRGRLGCIGGAHAALPRSPAIGDFVGVTSSSWDALRRNSESWPDEYGGASRACAETGLACEESVALAVNCSCATKWVSATVYGLPVDPRIMLLALLVACTAPYYFYAIVNYNHRSDKFRHCWAACQIAKTCGGGAGQLAGLTKELRDRVVRLVCDLGLLDKNSDFCKDSTPFWESIDDILANQTCVPWETYIPSPVFPVLCRVWRESCECCCLRAFK